ncbi:MAG TPA: aminopeptidase P family protein [Desulfobacteraceae bacterium]|nr:aminopeptidase P family protein [Deltaproteobacteria bacterium]RLB22604.1 MAG: aminopeptidase P family protein [Deltaproteobacteria bacterium]HDH87409.1 aminopeptidase P family protein [Desulfobacteraceae bacterium]
MNNSIFENRLDLLRSKFARLGVDTIWIIQPENRRYLSGFKAADGQFDESSGCLFITLDQALLVTDSRYTIQAQQDVVGFEVVTHKKGLIDILPEIFDRLNTQKLGFEGGYLIWDTYQKAKEKASQHSPSVELIAVSNLVEEIRMIKGPEEVDMLSRSAQLMGNVLARVISELTPGQVEKDIAWKIEALIREQGADGASFPPIVASGPNGALPHAVPTERRIGEGEPIILDVGAKLNGYCSDMTRTVFLGNPPSDFKEIYRVVRKAQLLALQSVRPGMKTNEADSIARDVIKNAGFGDFFGHSLGHGIGMAPHERPSVGPLKPEVLKEGMVFTIEPGIYIPGNGGVRLEEMVVLEGDGARVLTTNKNFYSF